MSDGLSIWTIYDHPTDYPNCFVARCFIYDQPTASVMICPDLERLRSEMINMGLVCTPRDEGDEPQIVESWM